MVTVKSTRSFVSQEPVQILEIEVTDDGEPVLTVPPAGKKMLEDVAKETRLPMKVVSVVGMMRLGKSFVMNQLLNLSPEQKGFSLGHTFESCTRGLWAWASKEKNHVLLCIDAEGLYDPERGDSDIDNKIFVLVLLLSSLVIYNVKHPIEETAIRNLNFVLEIAKYVSLPDDATDATPAALLPHLLFLMRDRILHWTPKEPDADAYLEKLLREDGDRMGCGIRASFPVISAFDLPKPCGDEELVKIEQHPECITKEFRNRMAELRGLVEDMTHVKEIHNPREDHKGKSAADITLTPAEFVVYFEYLVTKTMKGVPDPAEIFEMTMQRMVAESVTVGQAVYKEALKDLVLPLEVAELNERILSAGEQALQKSLAHVKGAEAVTVAEEMQSWFQEEKKVVESLNLQKSIDANKEAFHEVFQQLQSNAELFSSKEKYFDAVKRATDAYNKLAKEPGAHQVYEEEMQQLSATATVRLQLTATEKETEEARIKNLKQEEEFEKIILDLSYMQREQKTLTETLQKQMEAEKEELKRLMEEERKLREENIQRANEAARLKLQNEHLIWQRKEGEKAAKREAEWKQKLHQMEINSIRERARWEEMARAAKRNGGISILGIPIFSW